MEKRIRFVWALSLVSALLVIGVQGYWLYNQYRYVIETYSEEIAEAALQATEDEYELRKSEKKSPWTYIIQRDSRHQYDAGGESANQKLTMAIAIKDSANLSLDSIQQRAVPPANEMLQDAHHFKFSFNADLPEKVLHDGVNRALTELFNPFTAERLDSMIAIRLPGMAYTITPWTAKDTTYTSQWEKTGSLLHPSVVVSYAYSPLEKMGALIHVVIPPQPLFKRMAMQLILASGLILLLIGCLIFQIKTILKQKKLSELRESFVNTMIHELKRPVQTLKAFLSFLGDKEMRSDEETTRKVVQDSMFELDNLSAYLNKLRDMLRTDSETTPLHITRFDLQELMEKIIRLTPIPAGKEVKLSAVYEMESPWIEADPVHIANILSNLIENAVKYSGQEVSIGIKARRKGRELWLSVTDNGIGIPFAEQEKVFAKFYRGKNLPDKTIPGLGLGLSYVKLITEAHQGNVSLNSCNGEGTSITLYFPQP